MAILNVLHIQDAMGTEIEIHLNLGKNIVIHDARCAQDEGFVIALTQEDWVAMRAFIDKQFEMVNHG